MKSDRNDLPIDERLKLNVAAVKVILEAAPFAEKTSDGVVAMRNVLKRSEGEPPAAVMSELIDIAQVKIKSLGGVLKSSSGQSAKEVGSALARVGKTMLGKVDKDVNELYKFIAKIDISDPFELLTDKIEINKHTINLHQQSVEVKAAVSGLRRNSLLADKLDVAPPKNAWESMMVELKKSFLQSAKAAKSNDPAEHQKLPMLNELAKIHNILEGKMDDSRVALFILLVTKQANHLPKEFNDVFSKDFQKDVLMKSSKEQTSATYAMIKEEVSRLKQGGEPYVSPDRGVPRNHGRN
jgi:hypothetical protein